jgi:hypothetical protein
MIERRVAELAEAGEQRTVVLRDAIADFVVGEMADRDNEIMTLKKQLADLQQKLKQQAAIDRRVNEISARLEEKQEQRDRGKIGTDGNFLQSMSMAFAQERQSAREEFKAAYEEMQRAFEAKLAGLEERLKSVPGRLPVAKTWQPENVTYQAEMVAHNGALYQARKDTGQAPGGSDWVCVARHGRDAVTPTVRGNYDVNESYAELDIVSFDGCAYIARSDAPGLCPNDGWEPLSKRGQRGRRGESVTGPRGEKGAKNEKGDSALEIVSWSYDVEGYRAIPFASNGTPLPALDLRPFLERFLAEASDVLVDQLKQELQQQRLQF